MKKLLLSIMISLPTLTGLAQSGSWDNVKHNGVRTMGISYKYLNLTNPADKSNQLGTTYFFPEFDFVKMNLSAGAWSWSYRNKLPGDFIGSGVQLVFTGEMPYYTYRPNATWIHNFIGWWNIAKNVKINDELAVAVGGHIGDYYLDYSLAPDVYYNPHGFYAGIGPVVMVDYLLPSAMVVHFESSLAYGQYLADGDGFGAFPAPLISNTMLELRTNSKVFVGLEYVTFFNRGDDPFRGQRIELKAGFRFKK
ncbi:hypothetical protein [Belliella pelovolcani]|nr:hypothetical protein [Belliella pelovolcani]